MNARAVLLAAIQIVRKAPKKLSVEVPPDQVVKELESLIGWISPELECSNIVKVTRCKSCSNYHRYKKKGAFKAVPFYACSLDMKRRDPEFFCKDGIEK